MSEKFVIKSPLELELRDINEICILKDQHWPLGLKKQFGLWFVITNETDKLFLLEKNKKIISFLRLKLRQILVNNTIFDSFYLTEVCVDKEFQNRYSSNFQLISALSSKTKEEISSDVISEISNGIIKMTKKLKEEKQLITCFLLFSAHYVMHYSCIMGYQHKILYKNYIFAI